MNIAFFLFPIFFRLTTLLIPFRSGLRAFCFLGTSLEPLGTPPRMRRYRDGRLRRATILLKKMCVLFSISCNRQIDYASFARRALSGGLMAQLATNTLMSGRFLHPMPEYLVVARHMRALVVSSELEVRKPLLRSLQWLQVDAGEGP